MILGWEITFDIAVGSSESAIIEYQQFKNGRSVLVTSLSNTNPACFLSFTKIVFGDKNGQNPSDYKRMEFKDSAKKCFEFKIRSL
jgi:hypothetical protein